MYAQAATATKPVVKTATVEMQTVEKQTTKVNKTSPSRQMSASKNEPIKLKISQSKVYLTNNIRDLMPLLNNTTNIMF